MFHIGDVAVYSYGFMIAIGIVFAVWYMASEGKKDVGLTFDQANSLFLLIFVAAVIGGKFFLFLEEPARYIADPSALFSGAGFVFYGSFLFAVPTMLLFFRKNNLPMKAMLDVMAITTCIVHVSGRIGCFLAGCCYGKPTNSILGVTYSDMRCAASPKGVPLHPTQLYEAASILVVMIFLFLLKKRRHFEGQLFVSYLILYAVGRFVIEFWRGDDKRGYLFGNTISHAQFIAVIILFVSGILYAWMQRKRLSNSTAGNL